MVSKFKSLALAGALMMVAAPAFAQDANVLGLDLDPFHIFTPAPAPAAAPAPMMKHHKKMMMHHKKKMMMHKKMMMKK